MANNPLSLQALREGHWLSSWDTWELQLVEPSLIPFCSFSVSSSVPKQCRQRGAHQFLTSSTVVSKDAPGVRARVTALVTKCCTNSTFWVLSDNTEHQIVFRKCGHANHAPRTGGHKERECLAQLYLTAVKLGPLINTQGSFLSFL